MRAGLALAVLCIAPARADGPAAVALAGRVLGASGEHTVHVALWDADGFLKKPASETRFAAGAELRFRFAVRPGRWAVSAYEDRNENGVLDMGLFGPKEPSGFWRASSGWHKPRFDEVASTVEREIAAADVTLK